MLILGRSLLQRVFIGDKITVSLVKTHQFFADIVVDIEAPEFERLEWRLSLGKTLAITRDISITLLKSTVSQAIFGFSAPPSITILREEVADINA